MQPVIYFPMFYCKCCTGLRMIRRNKYYLWSLLNQQNQVIDLAPHIASRILGPFGSEDSLLCVLMLSWFQYRKKGGHLQYTTGSIRTSSLLMLKAGTQLNFWHCFKGLELKFHLISYNHSLSLVNLVKYTSFLNTEPILMIFIYLF